MAEQFEYVNVKTGGKFLSDLSPDAINRIAEERDFDLEDFLARITLDKKIKDFLTAIKDVAVTVGKTIVKIGKFVLNLVFELAETFPATVKGAVVGASIGFLLSTIPLIGWILGPIAISTFAFVGSVVGLADDLVNMLTNEKQRETLKNALFTACTGLAV
ncbi:MAG: hypothetical protein II811_03330 [Spirochaetaceae bacterium]|nr:hypothetical protein [Spirochaetaceae bacterium]